MHLLNSIIVRVTGLANTLLLLLAVLFLAGGCTKKQAGAPAPGGKGGGGSTVAGSPKPKGTEGASANTGTVKLTPVHPTAGGAEARGGNAKSAGGSESRLEGTDRLLVSRGGSTVYPSDYEIGTLQPQVSGGTEQGAIVRTIESFFKGLSGGKVDTKLLSPAWKDELIRRLNLPEKEGELPTSVRIGTLRVEQDRAHAAIRMEKGSGSAAGEIYLERNEGKWYISDIQADFSQLDRPAVRSAPFDPAEWKSMIKE